MTLADGRDARLLRALATVRAAGAGLDPVWDPRSRVGFTYGGDSTLDNAALYETLEELADQEYVERVFVERLTLCPHCNSHAINVHEACLSCRSSNLVPFKALFHFRCGFVGPVSAFRPEPQGRRCPKCAKILADLGTDHDSPGDFFRCRSCASMFQDPEVAARCLSCSARFAGREMQSLRHRDVFAYRLAELGEAALRENRLLESPAEALHVNGSLVRRDTIVDRIETERRARIESGRSFGVIVVRVARGLSPGSIVALRRELAPPFELGRIDAGNVLALLPGASETHTESLRARIEALPVDSAGPLRARAVAVEDGDDVRDVLAFAVSSLESDG